MLQRGFGGANQLGSTAQARQLERANALVQLAARLTQQRRVDRVELSELSLLTQMAAQRLVGKLKRAPKRHLHPGQRAEIAALGALGDRHQRFGFIHLGYSTALLGSGAAAGSGRAAQS